MTRPLRNGAHLRLDRIRKSFGDANDSRGLALADISLDVNAGEFYERIARFVASELLTLTAVRERVSREVAIHLASPPHGRATFEAMADVLTRHRGDRRVRVELDLRGHDRPLRVWADLPQVRVRPSERLIAELERICGAGSVHLGRG